MSDSATSVIPMPHTDAIESESRIDAENQRIKLDTDLTEYFGFRTEGFSDSYFWVSRRP